MPDAQAVILLIKAGVLIWLAATVVTMFDAIMAATARAKANHIAAEASQKGAMAGVDRAEAAH